SPCQGERRGSALRTSQDRTVSRTAARRCSRCWESPRNASRLSRAELSVRFAPGDRFVSPVTMQPASVPDKRSRGGTRAEQARIESPESSRGTGCVPVAARRDRGGPPLLELGGGRYDPRGQSG